MSVGRVVRTRVFHSLRLYKDVNPIIIIILLANLAVPPPNHKKYCSQCLRFAEGIPPPDSDLTDAPLEFPLFEPLDIKPHNAIKRSPLGEISGNQGAPSRSSWGCKQCRVVLCRDGGCWEAFHTVEE